MNRLESHQYHQGRRLVDEYINEFEELIEKYEYTDGKAIIMKFRRGLDPTIQNRIALMIEGRPSDEQPSQWYHAARMVAIVRAANDAFLAPRVPVTWSTASLTGVRKASEAPSRSEVHVPVCPTLVSPSPVPTPPSGPAPMDVDAARM